MTECIKSIFLSGRLLALVAVLWSSQALSEQFPLPTLNHVSLQEVDGCSGGACADVMPWVDIQFTHTSCGKKEFEIVGEQQDDVVYIRVLDKTGPQDCRGPELKQTYSVEVSDVYQEGVRYVVLNPLAP